MKDLGQMGESQFSHWCAEAGLTANASYVDETGWDFLVEFPFESALSPQEIHKSAFECKVQVKATDKKDRKLSITLSNLRRLATDPIPTFFVFIEFDNKNTAQRAFVVHVDNELISKVLKKIHKIKQSDKDDKFNKRTMTVRYDESNILDDMNGNSLKSRLLRYIGSDISEYIAKKKAHLQSTGYENGHTEITFTTEGEDNIKTLIDVSLGIKDEVEVKKFVGVDMRFGITSNNPSLTSDGGKFAMPGLTPTSEGVIRFKEDRLSSGLVYKCKFYNSPFNRGVPNELKKIRVVGDFFDFQFNPFTGEALSSISLGEGLRLEIKKFRDAIRLLNLLSSSGKTLIAELVVEGFPKLELSVSCNEQEKDFLGEIEYLDRAVKLIEHFEYTDIVDISLEEISVYGAQIRQLESILNPQPSSFKAEFEINGDGYDPNKETACLFILTTSIGRHIFGFIIVLIGHVDQVDGDRFKLETKNYVIEKKIVSEKGESIPHDDLVSAVEAIEQKYDEQYSVVTTGLNERF